MRKLLVAGVAAVMAVGAIALTRPSLTTAQNQAKKAEPDSVVAPRLTAADSSRLKGPKQPIFFRHDIHAGQYKIQCQYCHYTVAAASEPGIPSLQTCMGCHLAIGGAERFPQLNEKHIEIRKANFKDGLRTCYGFGC